MRTNGTWLLPEMITAWGAATPDAIAAVSGERELTYRELLDGARRVAGAVRRAGVRRDEVVGLACERGLAGLTGMLGVLLAGAAYLYLDPDWPAERLRHMAERCRLPLILLGPGADRSARPPGPATLGIDEAAAGDPPPGRAGVRPGDLCYVVYTSGSTGAPKGVAVEHGGAGNMARRLAATFGVAPRVRMLQFASWAWDAAGCEIMVTLGAGGTLVIAGDAARQGGEELAALLRARRVQVATITPSLLAALPEVDLPDLHTVVAVGEECPPELVARWAPGRRFLNGYGPSEATVAVSVGRCRPGEPVTIGRPLRGVLVRVVDESGAPVPDGYPGELLVGGPGVARGYVAAPSDRYPGPPVVTPGDRFFEAAGGRWYRTGDLVCRRRDRSLCYLGRVDDQVKVRGHRVELAEVEQGLRRHPGVRACAVVAGGGRLVAYVVPGAAALSGADVLAAAARWLPDFMLPGEVRLVDVLPLTGNGKLNRPALGALAGAVPSGALAGVTPSGSLPGAVPSGALGGVMPSGALAGAVPRCGAGSAEQLLADALGLIREVLETDEVGPDDDIFDVGGHSLVAAQLAVVATERFGVPVAALQVYDHPTAARLAALVGQLGVARKAA